MSNPPWRPGDELEERELPPTERLPLIRYAGASGDYNPIHTIDAEAERAGLPGIIQHGMLTMAQMGSIFSPYLGEGFIERFQTRFVGMVFLGDRLRISARVTEAEPVSDGEAYTFEVNARTTEGRAVARSTVRFRWLGPGEGS